MSDSASRERSLIAEQVADALRLYQATLDRWVLTPGDLDQYSRLCSEIDSIRALSLSALPEVTASLARVVLAHTDLTFIVLKKHLVRLGAIIEDGDRVAQATEMHRAAVTKMCELCERLSKRRKS